MPKNQSGYSQGERWHLLYEYFITHSGKDRPITTDEIISFYRSKGIEVHINTLYADIATIQTEIFGLEIEFDRQYNHGAGAYILQNPPFEPNELRLIIDSIQASKFITEAQAKKLSEKVLRYVDERTRVKLPTQTFVPDRVRNMNESAVRGAERIYEAIANDEKIAFKVFHYGRDGKKIYSRAGKPYIVSPYATIWLKL